MPGILRLEGIELSVTLGILPEETLAPRLVKLDIECGGDWSPGSPPLIDYREISDAVSGLSGFEYGLLEDLVSDVAHTLDRLRPGLGWRVTAVKPCPALSLRVDRAVFTWGGG
ncbi:MAG TPA: dihydroneopterin aldolase [Candidatus Fermentibacter sp.]|nr:dihydroneopterin aldolase [Candidatus Fermentibacter sp.]